MQRNPWEDDQDLQQWAMAEQFDAPPEPSSMEAQSADAPAANPWDDSAYQQSAMAEQFGLPPEIPQEPAAPPPQEMAQEPTSNTMPIGGTQYDVSPASTMPYQNTDFWSAQGVPVTDMFDLSTGQMRPGWERITDPNSPTQGYQRTPQGGDLTSWVRSMLSGASSPQALAALEPQLNQRGIKLQKDSAGNVRGRLYLPDGTSVDVVSQWGQPWTWTDRGAGGGDGGGGGGSSFTPPPTPQTVAPVPAAAAIAPLAPAPPPTPLSQNVQKAINDALTQGPIVNENDPSFMAQDQANKIQSQRAASRARMSAAQRMHARGQGESGAFDSEVSRLEQQHGETDQRLNAALRMNFLENERQRYAQALNLGAGLMSSQDEQSLRARLAEIQRQIAQTDLTFRYDALGSQQALSLADLNLRAMDRYFNG